MTSLEKILAFNNLKFYLSEEEQNDLKIKLKLTDEDIKRTWGKEIEDTFFTTLLFNKNVKHIIPFDESFCQLTGTPSCDGIVILTSGEKLLIEVKGSHKKLKKITSNRLNEQIALAKQLAIPLYFAVFLEGYWGFYTAEYIQEKGNKINFPDDFYNSIYEEKFDDFFVGVPTGLKIKKYYSNDSAPLVGSKVEGYGFLYKYELQYEDKVIPLQDENSLVTLAAIETELSNRQSEKINKLSENNFEFVLECTHTVYVNSHIFLTDLVYKTKNERTGQSYDSSMLIKKLLEEGVNNNTKSPSPIKLNAVIKKVFNSLKKMGVPFQFKKLKDLKDVNLILQ